MAPIHLQFQNPNSPIPTETLTTPPMAGRSRLPPTVLHLEDHPPPLPRHHPYHAAAAVAALEDRLAAQHREIHTLLLDNQSLAATHVALKQDLTSSQYTLRVAADSTARTKAHKDAQVKEVYERCIRVEDEVRTLDAMRVELVQVKLDVGKLGQVRDEMLEKLKELKGELGKVKEEMGRTEEVKTEIEIMRKELERGRLAVEYEKKLHADNLEQRQTIDKNMAYLGQEVENLRAELVNIEKRSRTAAAAVNSGQAYVETYGNTEMAYGTNAYSDAYSSHQLQGGVSSSSQYESAAVPYSSYDIQQPHAP